MATRRVLDSPEVLLHKDHYEPEELADLLGMDCSVVRHAAFTGELKSFIVDHHILCIRREDALRWLRERE